MHNKITKKCARNMVYFLGDLIHDEENAGYDQNVKDLKTLIEFLEPIAQIRCEVDHGGPCKGEITPCTDCGKLMCDEDGTSSHPYTCSNCYMKIDHNKCNDAECISLREKGII